MQQQPAEQCVIAFNLLACRYPPAKGFARLPTRSKELNVSVKTAPLKMLGLVTSTVFLALLTLAAVTCNQGEETTQDIWLGFERENEHDQLKQLSAVESLFGQVAKTVVYGGAELVRWNSRLLCTVMAYETELNNTDQPTLFAFNNPYNVERAYRIFANDAADDDHDHSATTITEQMLAEAEFDPQQMTFVFVHGWLGGIHQELWLTEAKTAALRSAFRQARGTNSQLQFRPNVIVVDWSQFAHGSLYTATQNSFKVSRRLGRLLGRLAQVGGLRPEQMHCFGHSIGAHICGQAARRAFPPNGAAGRMGRITGLDPGGFCYELDIKNETSYLGLRPSDAHLVDAYYSNRSPFGNKYQVAHYNVRLGNGYFQRACSVWRNPDVATKYFRAAVQFLMGHSHHNDILTCDHYFATRFAHQLLAPTCSYVAYACDSYRNFLRGQCGLCQSPTQCYSMDFEYQRPNATVGHALEHIAAHSAPPDGVAYAERRAYYMQVGQEEPYCSMAYRIRVRLNATALAAMQQAEWSFRVDKLKLQLIGAEQDILRVREANRGRLVHSISLNGPWVDETRASFYLANYGVDNSTLTALVELAQSRDQPLALAPNGRFLEAPISDVIVVYHSNDAERRRLRSGADSQPNPIEHIRLDYLSSSDERIRSQNSLLFAQKQFTLLYKQT